MKHNKEMPTEETIINNSFKNNISLNRSKETLFFLNSYGTLYSIDSNLLNINWFINLSTSTDLAPNNLFSGVEIVTDKDKIIVSSNNDTYIINIKTGLVERKFNFSSLIRPIINNFMHFLSQKMIF